MAKLFVVALVALVAVATADPLVYSATPFFGPAVSAYAAPGPVAPVPFPIPAAPVPVPAAGLYPSVSAYSYGTSYQSTVAEAVPVVNPAPANLVSAYSLPYASLPYSSLPYSSLPYSYAPTAAIVDYLAAYRR